MRLEKGPIMTLLDVTTRSETPALTPAGRRVLEHELHLLRDERLPALVTQLVEAREDSATRDEDLGLLALLDEQNRLRRRVQTLEWLLSSTAALVSPADGVAALGSWVAVEEDGERETFQLVDPCEANVAAGRVPIDSPVGRWLLGHQVGETVVVPVPAGERCLRIVSLAWHVE